MNYSSQREPIRKYQFVGLLLSTRSEETGLRLPPPSREYVAALQHEKKTVGLIYSMICSEQLN